MMYPEKKLFTKLKRLSWSAFYFGRSRAKTRNNGFELMYDSLQDQLPKLKEPNIEAT